MDDVLNFKNRNIAITDLETTGLDPLKHEIIEIGLVLIKQPSLEIIETIDIKVKPQNIETASPEALQLNGYKTKEWENAMELKDALTIYLEKTKDAIFCAHNTNFDFPFIKQACIKMNLTNTMDYHCIDIPTLVWLKYRTSSLEKINLSKVAEFIGLEPEPAIHRAINGAMLAYKVLKKIILESEK